MRHYGQWIVSGFVFWGGACASSSGAGPQAKTIAQHEAAAAAEESQAAALCQGSSSSACSTGRGDHQASSLREMAARHRAEAKALRDAEERACAGIPVEDRDKSVFFHDADIRSVSRLRGMFNEAEEDFDGASIVFRATPGLTAEWLQRIVECHLAKNAAVGAGSPELASSPLAVPGASATVASVGDGFALEILSDNEKGASEIWRRAQRVAARR